MLMGKIIWTAYLLLWGTWVHAQDTLKVHFLYGSTPIKTYGEEKWFGGKLGGHVGVEVKKDRIFNFVPSGKYHVFQNKKDKHSDFVYHTEENFYGIFGGQASQMKKTVVYIPITPQQKLRFDSLTQAYRKETPYDYAFFGMRCGAAGYDVLAQLEILPARGYHKTWFGIFYPKKLRKRLLNEAQTQGWKVQRQAGTHKRRWERD